TYLKGLRTGFVEAMSMVGVTPASAYCGAKLVEAVGLDPSFLESEFPGVPGHLGGLGPETLDEEWLAFHAQAFQPDTKGPADVGESRYRHGGRPHFNGPDMVRALHEASGYQKKAPLHAPASPEAYAEYTAIVTGREPVTILDLVQIKEAGTAVPLDEVE